MIKRLVGMAVLVMMLSACATTYTYEGQKYDSKEKFQQAVADSTVSALATITPLATPLTQRKLVFAIPGEATLVAENVKRTVALNSREPGAQQMEIIRELSKSNFKGIKVFYDAIQKKGIFSSTQFIEMQAMTGSFAPSADTDTLYFVEPSSGSGQWYYASLKQGKQVFAHDRSATTPAGKVQAFVDAVQAQAVRD